MGSGWPSDSTSEWWNSLDFEEQVLGKHTVTAIEEEICCSWADHRAEEDLTLFPICFLEAGSPPEKHVELSDTTFVDVDDLFPTPTLNGELSGSPDRFAFKEAFIQSSKCLTAAGGNDSAIPENSVLSNPDEGSGSVSCTLVEEWNKCTRNSQTSSGKGSSNASELLSAAALLDCCPDDEKVELSEHEGDSKACPMEIDLQCKGEHLGLDGEEDSSAEASNSIGLLRPTADSGCASFIPVTTAAWMHTSSPSPSHGSRSLECYSNEAGNETEDSSSKMASADEYGDEILQSPGAAPVLFNDILDGPDGKAVKPGRLMDVASATDIAGAVRRRPGRPSKPTAVATEAKVSYRRRRAITSKPAPAVSGQACTQCSTHVTPVWRAGPEGPKTLCNACGVRYMKVAKRK